MGDLLHLHPPNGETTSASLKMSKTKCMVCGDKPPTGPKVSVRWHYGNWLNRDPGWLCPSCYTGTCG